MLSDIIDEEYDSNKIVAKLMLNSTASILENSGFSTAKRSALVSLNILQIKFLEHLSKNAKTFAEENGENALTMELLQHLGIDLQELAEYMRFVAPFSSFSSSSIPLLPVQNYCSDEGDFTALNMTVVQPEERINRTRQEFPIFAGKTLSDLNMCDASLSTPSPLDGTLDSLASPVMALRRMATRKKSSIGRKMPNQRKEPSEEPTIEKMQLRKRNDNNSGGLLKSVLSKQGLKLRLMNNNANTPPGYFSSKSRVKKN